PPPARRAAAAHRVRHRRRRPGPLPVRLAAHRRRDPRRLRPSAGRARARAGTEGIVRVLITGGASGLGAAVVEAVAKEGGRPLVIDRSPMPASPASGVADVEHVQADVADRLAVERAVADLARAAGGLDAVVTAAGIDACGRLADVPGAEWERVIKVNL